MIVQPNQRYMTCKQYILMILNISVVSDLTVEFNFEIGHVWHRTNFQPSLFRISDSENECFFDFRKRFLPKFRFFNHNYFWSDEVSVIVDYAQ